MYVVNINTCLTYSLTHVLPMLTLSPTFPVFPAQGATADDVSIIRIPMSVNMVLDTLEMFKILVKNTTLLSNSQ